MGGAGVGVRKLSNAKGTSRSASFPVQFTSALCQASTALKISSTCAHMSEQKGGPPQARLLPRPRRIAPFATALAVGKSHSLLQEMKNTPESETPNSSGKKRFKCKRHTPDEGDGMDLYVGEGDIEEALPADVVELPDKGDDECVLLLSWLQRSSRVRFNFSF